MATLRQNPQDAPPPMCPCAIAVLLRGWSQDGSPMVCADDAHARFFDLFSADGMGQLWTQHESYLRGMAQQWGWTPGVAGADGRLRFYGEAANVLGREP